MAIIKRLEKGSPLSHGELDNNFTELVNMINAITHTEVLDILTSTEVGKALSANQGRALKVMIDTINTTLASDDVDLNNVQEIVNYIKVHETRLNGLGITDIASLQTNLNTLQSNIDAHATNLANPHGVTKTQVGLGNVDNTSDLDKPISTAQQTAFDGKVSVDGTKVLSDTNYTQSEKDKLAALESSHFKGEYASVAALEAAHPTGVAGDYAHVDLGAANKVTKYVYDVSDADWVEQLGEATAETAASIKSKYESNPDTNPYADADKAKVDGIEAGATGDMTDAEIKTAYERNANTNAFLDADRTKVDGIEAGATADQTGAEIKAAYEAEADTNAFTDAEKTKLAGIEDGATATAAGAVITKDAIEEAMGYFLDPARDQFIWNTGNSNVFVFSTELIHEMLITVNGQLLSDSQVTVNANKLDFTINETLQDGDIIKAIYLRKWSGFEPETEAYMTATATPYDATVVHNSLTGKQVWDQMDSLIKTAKSDGSWSTINAWHPMFGGTAAKHGYNVKDTTKHYMSFRGNWTINSSGNKGGGTAPDFAEYDTNPTTGFTGDNGGWTIGASTLLNATAFLNGTTDATGTSERFGTLILSSQVTNDFNQGTGFRVAGAFVSPMLVTAGMWNDTDISILNGGAAATNPQDKPTLGWATGKIYYGSRYRNSTTSADNPSASTLTSIAYHTGDPAILPKIHTMISNWETFLGRK